MKKKRIRQETLYFYQTLYIIRKCKNTPAKVYQWLPDPRSPRRRLKTQRLQGRFKCDGNILYSDDGGTIQLYRITSFTLKINNIVQLSCISVQMDRNGNNLVLGYF